MDELSRLTPRDDAEEIRAQLKTILEHPEFQATERLRNFLRFVVEEALAGRSAGLKGYTVATRVFGRNESFDPSRDPIVRIEAGRLRRSLERYYLVAGDRDPIRIEIPKGRYVPRFTRQVPARTRATDFAFPDSERPPLREDRPTIAVLPFRDLTGDPARAFFVSGLVEELVNEVNQYDNVIAIACQQAELAVDGGGGRPAEGNIEARFMLGGSVRRDDAELKIAAQLTDTATVRQVWGESYRVPLEPGQMLAAQEGLARDMVAAIADDYGVIVKRLTRESRQVPPSELSTYDALLRYHHYMLVMTPGAYQEAFESLLQATEAEPAYGPTWSALANLHAHAYSFDLSGFTDPLETAFDQARLGSSLAPDSQLARTILAYVYLLRGERERFLAEADTALALNPNSPSLSGLVGYLLACAGEYERAVDLLDRAVAMNPCHPRWFHHGLFVIHFSRGDYQRAYEEADQVGHQVRFWDPALRAAALGKLGRTEEARASIEELRRLKPDFEHRVRDFLPRTATPPAIWTEFLDGLKKAGFEVGP
jgi:adenylate cyclase